MDRKQKKEF